MRGSTEQELRNEITRLQGLLDSEMAARTQDAEASRGLRRQLTMMESVLEIVPVGVVIADAKGKIVLGNDQVEEMVRHPVLHSADTESYGEWVSFHADGRRVQSHEYPLARVISDGEDEAELDVHYQRGDGSKFWMRIIGRPVVGESGERIGAAVALVDIDEERRLMAQQDVLIKELNHRVKNAFAVVKSIVSQSLRKISLAPSLRETIDKRLDAYAKAHSQLVGSTWDYAPVMQIAEEILVPIGDDRVTIDGPYVEVPTRAALALSMAFYELATNALKYGALSVPEGHVELTWSPQGDGENTGLLMEWRERGGPKPVEPVEKGFGSVVINRALAMETGGRVHIEYELQGLLWRLTMPIGTHAMEDTYD